MNDYEIERLTDNIFMCDCPSCNEARDKRLMEDMGIYYGARTPYTNEHYLKTLVVVPDSAAEKPMALPLEFEEGDGLACIRGLLNALGIMVAVVCATVAAYLLMR